MFEPRSCCKILFSTTVKFPVPAILQTYGLFPYIPMESFQSWKFPEFSIFNPNCLIAVFSRNMALNRADSRLSPSTGETMQFTQKLVLIITLYTLTLSGMDKIIIIIQFEKMWY